MNVSLVTFIVAWIACFATCMRLERDILSEVKRVQGGVMFFLHVTIAMLTAPISLGQALVSYTRELKIRKQRADLH
jgi:hypothetical protein